MVNGRMIWHITEERITNVFFFHQIFKIISINIQNNYSIFWLIFFIDPNDSTEDTDNKATTIIIIWCLLIEIFWKLYCIFYWKFKKTYFYNKPPNIYKTLLLLCIFQTKQTKTHRIMSQILSSKKSSNG